MSSGPDTPTSIPSRISTWGLDSVKQPTDSPTDLEFHDQLRAAPQHPYNSPYLPTYHPEDIGYESGREELTAPTSQALTPNLPDSPVRPALPDSLNSDEAGWQLVANSRNLWGWRVDKPKPRRPGYRPHPKRDLGTYRPQPNRPPSTSVYKVDAVGVQSRPPSIASSGPLSGHSDAEKFLSNIHHASPPPTRGGAIRGTSRPPSKVRNENEGRTYANVLSAQDDNQKLGSTNASLHPTPTSSTASLIMPGPSRGRDREPLAKRPVNIQHVTSDAETMRLGQPLRSAPITVTPYSVPSLSDHSRHLSDSNFNPTAMSRRASDQALTNLSSSSNDAGSSHVPMPIPYERDISVIRRSAYGESSPPYPYTSTSYQQPPPGPSRLTKTGPDYGSQPMSRGPSDQSNYSAVTEPPRQRPAFSSSPRYGPTPGVSSLIDLRTAPASVGTGSASTAPIPFSQRRSRASSGSGGGPGLVFPSGVIEFGKLRFGELEPVSVEEARGRVVEGERKLRENSTAGVRRGGDDVARAKERTKGYPDVNLIPTGSDAGALRSMVGAAEENHRGLGLDFGDA